VSEDSNRGVALSTLIALLALLGAGGYCLYVAVVIAWSLL